MVTFIASFGLPVSTDRLSLYGFAALALVLLGLVALDMRRIVKATARKSSPMHFLSPHRDENGLPIFFEQGEDPSERAALRLIAKKRHNER